MKIKEIVNVVNAGILSATGHTLPEEEYYKFFKFKRSLKKLYDNFSNAETDLLKDIEISSDEIKQLDGRIIIAPRKEDGTIDNEKLSKYYSAVKNLLEEDVTIDISKKIPIKYYKNIYDENCKEINGKKIDIFASNQLEDFIVDNLFEEEIS